MSYSKYIFLSSLACFSLLQQPALVGDTFDYWQCSSGANCIDCASCEISGAGGVYSSYFGQPFTCGSTTVSSLECVNYSVTSPNLPILYLNSNISASNNYAIAYSASGSGSNNPFDFSLLNTGGTAYTYELGLQYTGSGLSQGINFQLTSVPTANSTIYLSNLNNSFASGTNFYIYSNTILQLPTGTGTGSPVGAISGVETIQFNGGVLSVPNGGTLSTNLVNYSTTGSGTIGGGTQSAPLIFTGTWGNINGTTTGSLYGYMNVTTGEIQSDGANFYVNSGAQLGLTVPGTSSSGSLWSPLGIVMNGGTVQFLSGFGDETLPNNIGLLGTTDSQFDINGLNITLGGALTGNSLNLNFINSNATPGVMTLGSSITGSEDVGYVITSGVTLQTNFSGDVDSFMYLYGGTLVLEDTTYTSTFTINDSSVLTAPPVGDNAIISGALAGAGSLLIVNGGTGTSTITFESISGSASSDPYTGTMTIGSSGTAVMSVLVYTSPSSGGTAAVNDIVVGPAGLLSLVQGSSDNDIYSNISSGGTYVLGTSPINGATLNFATSATVYGSVLGNLLIDIPPIGYSDITVTVKGGDFEGCVVLQIGSSISLPTGNTLTLGESQVGSSTPSQINGNITGSGDIVIAGNTNFGFGTSTSSYPTISFNSLTFDTLIPSTGGTSSTPALSTVYSVHSLGSGSGTLIGNGGEINNESGENLTIANPWTLNGLGTTIPAITFEGSQLTITGPITTAGGSGTTALLSSSSSTVSFTPSALILTSDTSLATNGNSITTGTISGSGNLVLGGGSTHSPITDTLTISGNTASTYTGIISENTNGGHGTVVILAPVTFTATNTFTEGLYLKPNGTSANTSNLNISSAGNLGSGTIYFEGGELSVMSVPVTASQTISFLSGTTTTFNVGTILVSGAQTSLVLELTGSCSIASGGTAYLVLEGGGDLIFGTTTTLSEGGTYNMTTSGKGSALVINITPASTTGSSLNPFLNDGVLWGKEEEYFALADASYANFGVIQVSSPQPAVINVVVEDGAFLTGLGEVTTVDLKSGGSLIPGSGVTLGVFTVTDSTVFESGSNYLIRTNGSASSLLDVGGEADVGSNVPVLLLPRAGNYTSTRHSILTAGNLSGRFHEARSPASFFLGLDLEYSNSNETILAITPRTTVELARGANAVSVGNAIDAAVLWNRENVSYDLFSLIEHDSAIPFLGELLATLVPFTTVEEMTVALNQLQPAFFKGFTIVQESNIVKVQDTLDLRMKYVLDSNSCYTFIDEKNTCCNKDEKPIHTWISGMGDILAQDSNTFAGSSQVGYQSKMGGFTAGVDGHFKAFYLGALGGYTTSYIKWRGHQGTGNINTGYAGLYLSAIGDMFYGNLSLIGGFSDFSGRRNIKYPGVDLTAKGNHAGKQLLSHADTGINWVTCGFTIRPFDAFDYITQTETGYIEQGVGEWGLTLNKTNAILLKNELGLEVSTCLCFSNMKWVIAPKASWIREVRVKGASYTAAFTTVALANAPFTVTGYFPDRSLFSPGVSLTGSMCQDRLSVELSYKGEFTHGYSDHSYAGEVRYGF